MNIWDYIIIAVIAAVIITAVVIIVLNRKKGKNSCGCDCAHCSGCAYSKDMHK